MNEQQIIERWGDGTDLVRFLTETLWIAMTKFRAEMKARDIELIIESVTVSPSSLGRVERVCRSCGRSNVSYDATAKWNARTGRYVLVTIHDNSTCEECGDEGGTIEVHT